MMNQPPSQEQSRRQASEAQAKLVDLRAYMTDREHLIAKLERLAEAVENYRSSPAWAVVVNSKEPVQALYGRGQREAMFDALDALKEQTPCD